MEHACVKRTAVIFLTVIFELVVKLTVVFEKRIHSNSYFFTVTVTLINLSVIFVTLIFVYAVNYCLIENSFDGHV